jgi:ParB family chromosome partitioning protein
MIRKVKIKDIRPNPFQPRKTQDPEAIKSLAEEIAKVGLWTGSIRGREKNGHVELCFGHRRLDAVKLLDYKEIEIDVVPLSDEDMALQALIENLQREGLNDVEKAEGVERYINIRENSKNFSREKILDELTRLLGFKESEKHIYTRINELRTIAKFDEPVKDLIREHAATKGQKGVSGKTAVLADRLGGGNGTGAETVKMVAEKNIKYQDLQEINSAIHKIAPKKPGKDKPPETPKEKKHREKQEVVQEKVRQSFLKGEITEPKQVAAKVRRLEGQAQRRKEPELPDLIDVMRSWTERATRWAEQLEEVKPYIDYIDREPDVAKNWREAAKALIEKLEAFV